jgi:hypothetical protein
MAWRRKFVPLIATALVYLACLGIGAQVVDWRHDDPTDEVEWVAISILHWRQVTRGGPPAGAELERGAWRDAGPWRSGAQRTMFGYPSPNLPKLVLGAVLAAGDRRSADPIVFDVFEQFDPAAGAAAARDLEPAARIARRVVFAAFALCATLLALIACELLPGARGWCCAFLTLLLWFASPVTRASATFIRSDYFMLACVLGALLYALRARDVLAGARGTRGQQLAGAKLGLLCGLAVASKLNGVLLAPVVALWILASWWRAPRAQRTPFLRGPLPALALAGLTTCAVFYALHPRLWSEPIAGARDVLERWRDFREFLYVDWAPRADLAVAHDFGQGWNLFVRGLFAREDPWRALIGVPGRWLSLPVGLILLTYSALRRFPAGDLRATDPRDALTLALAAAITALGTALWLPIDWPRYWIPAAALAASIEGWALTTLLARSALGLRLFQPRPKELEARAR